MYTDLFAHKTTTMQLYRRMMTEVVKEQGMTQMEMDVLMFLTNNPQYDTARDLVEVRHLSKSHVSTAVDALVNRHFLERTHVLGNKKLIHLKVLPAAEETIQRGREAQQIFFDQLFLGFTTQERALLNNLLNRVERNAQTALEKL